MVSLTPKRTSLLIKLRAVLRQHGGTEAEITQVIREKVRHMPNRVVRRLLREL